MPNASAIPDPTADVPGLFQTVMALKQAVELLSGARGTSGSGAATQSSVTDSINSLRQQMTTSSHWLSNAQMAQMAALTVKANITAGLADVADVSTTALRTAMLVEILGQITAISTYSTTSNTLVLTDVGKLVEVSNAAANTLIIPPHASVAFPVNTILNITQTGAGQTTVTAGSGVTIRQRSSRMKLSAQWAMATIYQRATDEWVLGGDLSA